MTTPAPGLHSAPAGISRWPDVEEVNARLKALVSQPLRPIRPEYMKKVLAWFDERCAGSKALAERARAVLESATTSNASLARHMAEVFAQASFIGNISLMKLVPGRTTRSYDIALALAHDEAWGITAAGDDQTMRVERMNATVLAETLRQGLAALDQPLKGL